MLIWRKHILAFCFSHIQHRNSICIQWQHCIPYAFGIYNNLCWQNARDAIQGGFTVLQLAFRDLQTVILVYYYDRLYRNLLFVYNLFFFEFNRFWNNNVQTINKVNNSINIFKFFQLWQSPKIML